jgi:hypothetical protein
MYIIHRGLRGATPALLGGGGGEKKKKKKKKKKVTAKS